MPVRFHLALTYCRRRHRHHRSCGLVNGTATPFNAVRRGSPWSGLSPRWRKACRHRSCPASTPETVVRASIFRCRTVQSSTWDDGRRPLLSAGASLLSGALRWPHTLTCSGSTFVPLTGAASAAFSVGSKKARGGDALPSAAEPRDSTYAITPQTGRRMRGDDTSSTNFRALNAQLIAPLTLRY